MVNTTPFKDLSLYEKTDWTNAVRSGKVEQVKDLVLKHKYFPVTNGNSVFGLLHRAVNAAVCVNDEGNFEVLSYLVKSGYPLNDTTSFEKNSLHLASETCGDGVERVINLLVASGINANGFNGNGDASLHLASRQGNFRAVRALLSAGADANLKSFIGYYPVENAMLRLIQDDSINTELTLTIREFLKLGEDLAVLSDQASVVFANAATVKEALMVYGKLDVLCGN